MNLFQKLWQAIKSFFSPTEEDWKDFDWRKKRSDTVFGSSGYDPAGVHDADGGDGGGDGGGSD